MSQFAKTLSIVGGVAAFIMIFTATPVLAQVTDTFESYTVGKDLDVYGTWAHTDGTNHAWIYQDGASKVAIATTSVQYEHIDYTVTGTSSTTNGQCFDLKMEDGTLFEFWWRNTAVSDWGGAIQISAIGSVLAEIRTRNSASWSDILIYYNFADYRTICVFYNTVLNQYYFTIDDEFASDIYDDWEHPSTIGMFQFNFYPYYDHDAHIYIDNLYGTTTAPEIIESQDVYIQPDLDLDADLADIDTIRYKRCTNGYACELPYWYNNLAIGDYIYLTDSATTETIYAFEIIPDSNVLADKITVPNVTTTQKKDYRLMLIDPDVTKITSTVTIDWFATEAEAEADLEARGAFQESECDDVCADIATTTGWWDDVRFGIECGMRNVSCWAFVPASTTYDKFLTAQLQLQYTFPMNVFRNIATGISNFKATSTATTTVPIAVTLHQTPLNIDLLDLSGYSNNVFYDLVRTIRMIFSFILSIFVVGYFILRLYNLAHKKPEETV